MNQSFPNIGFYLDEKELDFTTLSYVGRIVFSVASAEYFFPTPASKKRFLTGT